MPANRKHLVIVACGLLWLILIARLSTHLPSQPQTMGDTQDYLTLASHRPPLYGWVLAAYQWATGGLRMLPLFQFALMSLGLLLFAIELGLLLDSIAAGPAAIVLILLHPTAHDAARIIMTESVYLGFVLAGLGLLFQAVRLKRGASLVGAATLFALAAATRTTGTAFLLLAPFVAFFDQRPSWQAGLARSGLSAAAMTLVLVTAMAGNWLRNDRFEIGSFAGVALLGKALTLIEPSDLSHLPNAALAAATATLVPAAQGRAIVATAPDPAAAMRAQMQISEDLRFGVFFPAAIKTWPAFASAPWRERAVLSSEVARPLILAHPVGYAGLWARDWEELVLYPNFWPAWATGQPGSRDRFPACRLQGNCYSLDRYDLPAWTFASLALVSLVGVIGGLLLILSRASAVLRRRADPHTALFFGCAMILHASLLLSAAAEAGFVRYTVALHALDVALAIWLVLSGIDRLAGRGGHRSGPPLPQHRPGPSIPTADQQVNNRGSGNRGSCQTARLPYGPFIAAVRVDRVDKREDAQSFSGGYE